MTDTKALHDSLQKAAGLKTRPTPLTHDLRIAVSGEGPRAYDWQDKPHRLLYDACTEVEALTAKLHAARIEGARLMQEAASKICAAQYPHLVRDEFASGRAAGVDACLASIEALDPTKIIEEADNAREKGKHNMTDEIHPAPSEFTVLQLTNDSILRFFHYAHLPPTFQSASKPFFDLARHIVETLPRCPERTVALRKLLEAKDAAVRTNVP